ncbi:hypothetical protein Pcinc_041838 [Petrolisthes cinctipes]|uniref:Uncharacterized protein n=1 Tax=Petrolisthes cinctipes TaxID=88211 RepID=A0AAE1BIU4_PETCI|nr:hypothetical protein Pcinc_041838 [Petrolisthes cinctipes]
MGRMGKRGEARCLSRVLISGNCQALSVDVLGPRRKHREAQHDTDHYYITVKHQQTSKEAPTDTRGITNRYYNRKQQQTSKEAPTDRHQQTTNEAPTINEGSTKRQTPEEASTHHTQ